MCQFRSIVNNDVKQMLEMNWIADYVFIKLLFLQWLIFATRGHRFTRNGFG